MALTGIIFLALILPFRPYLRSLGFKRIKNNLKENEEIKYIPKFTLMLDYLVPLLIGCGVGYILPFWINTDFQKISVLTGTFIFIFTVMIAISILTILAIYSKIAVLTNIRILILPAFPLLDKLFGSLNIEYSDIDFIRVDKNPVYPVFYLKTVQGKLIPMDSISNWQEFKDKIEELSGKRF